MNILFFFIILLSTIFRGEAIIGYDCGARSLNITTISLLDVAPCDVPTTPLNSTHVQIQLLQLNQFKSVHTVQCKLILHRVISYCGMHSHNSAVEFGVLEYMVEISRDTCLDVYQTGTLRLDDVHIFRDIRVNQTTQRPVVLAGGISNNGGCSGAAYSDAYGSWQNVIVQGYI